MNRIEMMNQRLALSLVKLSQNKSDILEPDDHQNIIDAARALQPDVMNELADLRSKLDLREDVDLVLRIHEILNMDGVSVIDNAMKELKWFMAKVQELECVLDPSQWDGMYEGEKMHPDLDNQ
tara:strand:+ start:206 stop:574 length:369 start_codon:yes stop_codon:yes gene_type:complete